METASTIFDSDLDHVLGAGRFRARKEYLILCGLVIAIQRGEINIAGSHVNVHIFVISSEDTVNNKGGKGKHQR